MTNSALIRAAILSVVVPINVSAALYWDLNGITAGASATPNGTWDGTATNWNPLSDGTGTPGLWISGDTAVFSAGTDATNAYTVTITGTQTAAGLVIEDGAVTLGVGAASIGAGPVTVGPGATLITNSSLRIAATAGSIFTLNGGTLQTTNASAAGSFIDADAAISLGAAGGSILYDVPNVLNIIQTNTVISGSGSLTKNGVGVIAIASASNYTGPTIINNGELRIRTSANRLPVGTAVTVNSPGILNLNAQSQQIGSLSGNGSIGCSGGTLTVGDATSTTFSGVIANVMNAGAGGLTTGVGRLTKVGSGTLTLTGVNTYTGSFTLSAGVVTVASGGALCGNVADIAINGGTLNLNNAAQTVENLNGTGGTINLAAGHTLTVNPIATSTYNGVIAGAGAFTKTSTFIEVLAGANTYTGATTISAGTLEISGSETGTSQVVVSGTLAGVGSIIPALNGDIDLLLGGKLSPGSSATPASSVGTLTIGLSGSGVVDLTAGVSPASSQSLAFELASPIASDKITSTGGSLSIGTGVLEFNDFSFTTLAGFAPNTDYLLFDGSSPVIGTFGASLTGDIGGFTGQLMLADGGNDIVLHVVPEPSAALALLGGTATLIALRRRRS